MGRTLVLLAAVLAMVAGGVAVVATAGTRGPATGAGPTAVAPTGGPPGPSGPEASYPPPMAIPDLYAAFATPGGTAASYGDPVTLGVVPAGTVTLPTGRLVGVDAMVIQGAEPYTTSVAPGTHPVIVLTADFESGDHRVAAALLRVTGDEPTEWELAVLPGQDAATLGPDEIFGYGVDSGTGAFTSPEAVGVLEDEAPYQAYSDEVFAAMFPDADTIVDTAHVTVDAASGADVVAFSSGFGDGVYATWLGLDDAGQPAVVLTDFGVLDAMGG